MGDGFLMVVVILSATHTAISSLLWLLLLIPAFFFFGKGFADVLLAGKSVDGRKKQRSAAEPQLPNYSNLAHRLQKFSKITHPGNLLARRA